VEIDAKEFRRRLGTANASIEQLKSSMAAATFKNPEKFFGLVDTIDRCFSLAPAINGVDPGDVKVVFCAAWLGVKLIALEAMSQLDAMELEATDGTTDGSH
jgi:hypothetical protein